MAAGTLVDANVLLDVLTEDVQWVGWSLDSLAAAAETGPLIINHARRDSVSDVLSNGLAHRTGAVRRLTHARTPSGARAGQRSAPVVAVS